MMLFVMVMIEKIGLIKVKGFLIRILFSAFLCSTLLVKVNGQARKIEAFNTNWRFYLGDDSLAINPGYKDLKWRTLNLPHDWSIEGAFSKDNPSKPEGGALPTGIAWYRKTFSLPIDDRLRVFYIDFDGIYRNSEVWINGHYLGKKPNGYVPFRYELSPYLKFGKEPNVIAVKVDNSQQPDSRWYSGSGIYRNVWLVSTNNTHIDHWGSFVTTPNVDETSASIELALRIRNKVSSPALSIETVIVDAKGNAVTKASESGVVLKDSVTAITQKFTITRPVLWSVENPYLYKAVTSLYLNNSLIDQYETPFGVRFFNFDSEKGFFLNGKPLKILGVCNHHDLGALGSAINKRAMERQLELLKAMGCNAIRTAHNPPATELLDLCDKMGFIVMDEAFDMWKKKKNKFDYHLNFPEWHKRDLEAMVKRDRNHPSVFIWSIGNEIREQFDSSGITITRELVGIVKNLDRTRPITSALTENIPSKNFIYQSGALDLLGFNYKEQAYADFLKTYPGQKFIATETTSGLQTRGHYDMPSDSIRRWPVDHKTPLTSGNADWTVSAYDNVSAYWGSTHEETWKVMKKYAHLSGLFVWTGFDYLGEPIPYPWPARSAYFGILDLAGFPKDIYYMYQSEWTQKPVLHLFPHWNWTPGKIIDVWAYYNNADEVELFLNGRSLGIRKKEGEELHVMWRIPYQPGTLKAVSRKEGQEVLTKEIKTAGKPAKIEVSADRNIIHSDNRDLSFVTVKVLDNEGNLVPEASNLVQFEISGEGSIAGVDNGYQASMEPFKADHRKAFNGLCLVIIQSNGKKGKVVLKASSKGLKLASLTIESK
jgi:beta-galactosidase